MQRIIQVLIASAIIAACILALCFIFGPTFFSHETIARHIGGNIGILAGVLTGAAYPVVNRYLR